MRSFLKVALLLCLPCFALASVTSIVDKTGPFVATGSFPQVIAVGFPYQQAGDLQVLDSGSSGTPRDPATVLVINSDYTVTGGGYNSANQMQTGNVSLQLGTSVILAGDQIIIRRNVPINQTASFTTTGPNTVALLEQALDKMATLSQQVNEIGGRSLQFENFELLNPALSLAQRKSMLLGFDANGNIEFYPSSGSGGGGMGTVTSVATGPGLTGGPFTVTGTISQDFTYGGTYTGLTFWRTTSTPDSFVGAPNWQALSVSNPSTVSGSSFGLEVFAGTSSSDWMLAAYDSSGIINSAHLGLMLDGAGQLHLPKYYSSSGVLTTDTSGNVTVGSAGGASSPTAALNVTALRALSSSGWGNGTVVFLAGYNTAGDGGGGYFAWQSSDTSSDNGGTVFKLFGTTTGRLHRVQPSSNYGSQLPNTTLDIRWFGAIPDSTTDCTPGILAAENSAVFSGSTETPTLYAPAGHYDIKTKLNLSTGTIGSFTLKGDGMDATVFVCNFASTDTAMWDLGNFSTQVSIRNCGFTYQSGSAVLPVYLYLHTAAFFDLDSIRSGGFPSGTFISLNYSGAWSNVNNVITSNTSGVQLLINHSGGVVSNFNLNETYGTPCLEVLNCDALAIHDGQCSGAGPYVSYTGSAVTSNSSTFTITQTAHGFTAGDYIYVANAGTNSGYVNKWKIQSVTANTITVASTANLGSDTVTFGSLWSDGYFGGAGSTGLDSESSCSNVLWNTGTTAPTGSCGLFLDGWSGGSVANIRFHSMLSDYGATSIFAHGKAASAYDNVNSFLYGVITSTANTFTLATGTSDVNIGSFVTGNWYCIDNVGTGGNWTSIGASSAAVGVIFQATGPGTGTGGTAAALTAHSLKPGGYVRITSSAYIGWWKITSVGTYTVTCNSTLNAGPLTTVAAEGDVLSSTVGGFVIDQPVIYCKENFGGIRLEGTDSVVVSNPFIYNGANAQTTESDSIVFSDGGQSIPQIDNGVVGGVVTNVTQTVFSPTQNHVGIVVDGPLQYGVSVKSVVMDGSVIPFEFINGATPNSCNLDTDYFKGASTICQLPSGGQVFTSGSAAFITWNTVSWDPLGMWNATNPTRITPPVGAQVVQLNAKTAWSAGVTPASLQILHYNSSGSLLEQNGQAYGASTTTGVAQTVNSGPVNIQPGDYFVAFASQTSGSSSTLNNGSPTGNVGFSCNIIK